MASNVSAPGLSPSLQSESVLEYAPDVAAGASTGSSAAASAARMSVGTPRFISNTDWRRSSRLIVNSFASSALKNAATFAAASGSELALSSSSVALSLSNSLPTSSAVSASADASPAVSAAAAAWFWPRVAAAAGSFSSARSESARFISPLIIFSYAMRSALAAAASISASTTRRTASASAATSAAATAVAVSAAASASSLVGVEGGECTAIAAPQSSASSTVPSSSLTVLDAPLLDVSSSPAATARGDEAGLEGGARNVTARRIWSGATSRIGSIEIIRTCPAVAASAGDPACVRSLPASASAARCCVERSCVSIFPFAMPFVPLVACTRTAPSVFPCMSSFMRCAAVNFDIEAAHAAEWVRVRGSFASLVRRSNGRRRSRRTRRWFLVA